MSANRQNDQKKYCTIWREKPGVRDAYFSCIFQATKPTCGHGKQIKQ